MRDDSQKRLRRTTFIYWMLLVYIVAALIWWFISLLNQTRTLRDFELQNLRTSVTDQPAVYHALAGKIEKDFKRNQSKYIGEGTIFFLLILVGAGFVYRSVRRQFHLQLQQQNFMMAVTHELKTPIAIASLNLETLQRYSLDAEKQKKLIKTTLDETKRLNFLTNNILVASQLDGGGYPFSKEELDLSDLVKDSLRSFKSRFPERDFTANISADAEVKGDSLLFQMLVNNLIENAIKYSPRDSNITVSLSEQKNDVQLQVIDQGAGIAEDEKKKIFSKFYRVGNEATRKTKGTGLGLYLCRKIMQDHNGDISVTNNEPHGTIFTVNFKNPHARGNSRLKNHSI